MQLIIGIIMSQVAALQNELFLDSGSVSSPRDEPVYETSQDRRILGPYVREAVSKIKRWYDRKVGLVPGFGNANVSLGELPIRRSWRTRRPTGVVHGMYDPRTGEATYNVHSVEFPGLPDTPEKRELREYGLTEHPESVVTHELVHHAQRETGMLQRYINRFKIFAKHPIEGVTTEMTEDITGREQTTYPHERKLARRLIDLYGKAKTALGKVPVGFNPQPAPAFAYAFASPRPRFAYAR